MKLIKRSVSLLLVGILAICLAACGNTASSSTASSSSSDTTSWRADPVAAEEKAGFVDTDGDFDYETVDWNGPEGYVIVIPAGNSENRKSAEYLQSYYKEVHGITLQIVTDATAATEKEILIGKTNRAESNTGLAEADLEVSVKNGKLVFDGGHDVTVNSAVGKFARKLPEPGKAITFKVTTDFCSTLEWEGLDGYSYVWGDEFEEADINYSKWDFEQRMAGTTKNEISWENDTIDVSDGRLQLIAHRYFNPQREGTQFRSPYSTLHKYHMNYIYGYCEIRARIPFEEGIWPSWWGLSGCYLASDLDGIDYQEDNIFGVEIDIYEIFGDEETVVPNIHKWYNSKYNYPEIHDVEMENNHTQWNKEKIKWKWSEHGVDIENLDNEYHIYGYEWTPTEVSMWVEGEKYMTFDIVNSYDLCSEMSTYQDPLYFMFNCHVFADDAEYQPNLINDNISCLPTYYCIDYYRVYQKNDSKSKIWIEDTPRDYDYPGRSDPWTPEE